MKKNNLLIGAFLLSLAFAQNTFGQVGIGVKGGVNFSSISGADDQLDKQGKMETKDVMKPGANAGLVFKFGITEKFAIQPEVLFSQSGGKTTFKETYTVPTGTISGDGHRISSRHYLELPILLKLTLGDGDFKYFVNAGPYLGYLIGGQTKFKDPGGSEGSTEIDLEERTIMAGSNTYKIRDNRFDVGVAAGFGVSLDAGPGSVFLETRYTAGFSDLRKVTEGTEPGHVKTMNRNLMFSLGYMLKFGGDE